MRLLPLVFLMLAGSLAASEPTVYPLWDGQESVADYAKKVNLPPTRTLDLGNGVKLELVLIPAGKFMMGTPEPPTVDEEGFLKQIETGLILLAVGAGLLLVLISTVIIRAIRKHQRPKFSLAMLLAMTVTAGIALLGGLHWRQSVRGLEQARADFIVAKARFDSVAGYESPAHPVTLTQPFYIGKYPITQVQYELLMANNPSSVNAAKNPVEQVSWNDAQEFCARLCKKIESTAKLPTEAQWEYACRAGSSTAYYFGIAEIDLGEYCWYRDNSDDKPPPAGGQKPKFAGKMTHAVGCKKPNAWGLYDMHGNVCQWCEDWFEKFSEQAAVDPTGSSQGKRRVMRGGSSNLSARDCRSAFRIAYPPERISGHVGGFGFRVVVPASTQP